MANTEKCFIATVGFSAIAIVEGVLSEYTGSVGSKIATAAFVASGISALAGIYYANKENYI